MGRKNLPPVAISSLPPHPMLEFPHLHPTPQDSQISLLLCFYPHLYLTLRLVCMWDRPKRKKMKLRWVMICWKKFYIYKLITREMKGTGVYYQNCVLWPPHWAPPLLHPLAPPLPHLPLFPLALPTWQMLIHSKWKERTESKIRAAKHEQLHEMEPLCIILRWCRLFLKTWMIGRWCIHTTSILEEIGCHFVSQKRIFSSLRGAVLLEIYIQRDYKLQCTGQCPKIAVEVSITQFLLYFWSSF